MNDRLFKTFPFKINGFVFLFSLLVFTLLIKLGLWQMDRATQKDLRLQKMELYQQQAAIGLDAIVKQEGTREMKQAELDEYNDLPVRLSGTFENTHSFLLDNQVYKGKLGYRVLKLFRDEKSAMNVLVNLGWIPAGMDRAFIPDVEEINGLVSFMGKIRVIEPAIVLVDEILQADNWPLRIQSIDINKISKLVGQPLLPFVVFVDNDESLGYIKEWVPIVMPPEKHRGYAFQWFTLAFAWLVLMASAAYKSARTNKEK